MTKETEGNKLPYPEDTDAPNGPAQIKSLAEAIETALAKAMPTGTILATGRSTAPTGYALCEGQSVVRTGEWAALFAAIGTTYGSVDGTHFTLPDLRGRVPVGVDGAAARLGSNDTLGKAAGEEKHTLTTAEMPSHNHGFSFFLLTSPGGNPTPPTGTGLPNGSGGGTTENKGGGEAHNIMQPYQIVNYMIKM